MLRKTRRQGCTLTQEGRFIRLMFALFYCFISPAQRRGKMPMTSVKEVSKYIIQSSAEPISNLKLQKLLYYVQGWSLALHDREAFRERIEAWVHGPVVPAAFYEYRHFGWNPIKLDDPSPSLLSKAERDHVDEVMSVYKQFSASQLESLSHDESPWIEARKGIDPSAISRNIIMPAAMKAFFSARVHA